MARRSLKPHLNQIRTWVRQGRTDAWIAHQLETTVQQVDAFKREHDLLPDGEGETAGAELDQEIDLRAEDDALIAAELEAEAAAKAEEEARLAEERAQAAAETPEEDEGGPKRRRRGRRGGRARGRKGPVTLEGTFDHGDEGYGLWLDPAIADDPIYAEHWAGHRPVTVLVEEERIIISRAGEDGAGEED